MSITPAICPLMPKEWLLSLSSDLHNSFVVFSFPFNQRTYSRIPTKPVDRFFMSQENRIQFHIDIYRRATCTERTIEYRERERGKLSRTSILQSEWTSFEFQCCWIRGTSTVVFVEGELPETNVIVLRAGGNKPLGRTFEDRCIRFVTEANIDCLFYYLISEWSLFVSNLQGQSE